MNRKPSPEAMRLTVDRAVLGAMYLAVSVAVNRAVYGAESFALREGSPHPNLDQFMAEVRQARGDAT